MSTQAYVGDVPTTRWNWDGQYNWQTWPTTYTQYSLPRWAVVGKCEKCGQATVARMDTMTVPKAEYICDCHDEPTEPEAGFIKNCTLIPRKDDVLFHVDGEGRAIPTLDGYTILPNEQYEALKEAKP